MAPAGHGPGAVEVPGVHVVDGATATALDAERATDAAELEALLEGRALPTPVGVDDLERLTTLSRSVAVAERLVLRTRDRAARRASEQTALAEGAGLSLHPESIRAAAAALVAARARVAELDAEMSTAEMSTADLSTADLSTATTDRPAGLDDGDELRRTEAPSAGAALEDAEVARAPEPDRAREADDEPDDRAGATLAGWDPARAKRQALGVGLVGAGGSLGAAGLGASGWVILVPLLVGLLAASWTLRVPYAAPESSDRTRDSGDDQGAERERRASDAAGPSATTSAAGRAHDDPDDRAEGSDRLAEIAALTDRAFGGGQPSLGGDPDTGRRAQRDLAAEEVRVAERAWHAIAGRGVEPSEVDDVVRRHDPQHQDALVLAAEATAVRAAHRLLEGALDRWGAAWQALGLDPPDPAVSAHDALGDLRRRATTPLVLSGPAADQAAEVAARLPAAAVLVLEAVADATVPDPDGSGTGTGVGADQPPPGDETVS